MKRHFLRSLLYWYMNFHEMIFQNPSQGVNSCIAIFGGGGKTSLLYQMGSELSVYYERVLLTSLTRSNLHPDHHPIFTSSLQNRNLSHHFRHHNPLYIMHSMISSSKMTGISEKELDYFQKQSDICIFECDGARSLSLKAHNDTDPSVPEFATHVVIVIGADVVDTSLHQGKVHRPELFKEVWNVHDDFILNVDFITQVVTSPEGYLSKIPSHLMRIYFINKADGFPQQAELLALSISQKSHCPTFYGSVHSNFWRKVR